MHCRAFNRIPAFYLLDAINIPPLRPQVMTTRLSPDTSKRPLGVTTTSLASPTPPLGTTAAVNKAEIVVPEQPGKRLTRSRTVLQL